MIKLKNLSSDLEFKKILNQKKIHTDYFSVYFGKGLTAKNNNLNISFIMKKKLGTAVLRNKIKRRLKSAVQKYLNTNKIDRNFSYVIFGKSKTYNEKYSIILDELNKTFFRIKQMNN